MPNKFFTLSAFWSPLLLCLFSGCFVAKPNLRYVDLLAPGSKLLESGGIWTLEKTADGAFVRRDFFYDTRQITSEQHYRDRQQSIKHGRFRSWTDEGALLTEGSYKNGQQDGVWKWHHPENEFDPERGSWMEGTYANGTAVGTWREYYASGKLWVEYPYVNGEKDGKILYYRQDGSVEKTELWKAGKLVESDGKKSPEPDELLYVVEVPPSFPCDSVRAGHSKDCGELSLQLFLANTIRYPRDAREHDVQGRAILSFIVDKDGKVTNIRPVRTLSRSIRAECIRVLNAMPTWVPGHQNGKPVRVRFTIPISFRLE